MKIKLSKNQWKQIGKIAGWGKPKKWNQVMSYREDQIDGSKLGQPNKWYEIEINGKFSVKDDSDMDRETGYGHLVNHTISEINEYTIIETDSEGNITRDQKQIKAEDPVLYHRLLFRAKEGAKKSFVESPPVEDFEI